MINEKRLDQLADNIVDTLVTTEQTQGQLIIFKKLVKVLISQAIYESLGDEDERKKTEESRAKANDRSLHEGKTEDIRSSGEALPEQVNEKTK